MEFQFNSYDVAEAGGILQQQCHGASHSAGWWTAFGTDLRKLICDPQDERERYFAGALVAQKLMLSVSELAEAMEGHRKGLPDDKLPHRDMLEVELADCVIRVFDLAGALNFDLGGAIAEKMRYNAQRPDHKAEARTQAGGKTY